jgi:phosphatidate cytidylyltransferase
MHLKRWLTGLIALPFLVFLIYKGGIWFLLLIFGGCALALWEYFRIVLNDEASILSAMTIIAMIAGLLLIWIAFRGAHELTVVVLAADLMAAGLVAIFQLAKKSIILDILKKQVLGVIYVPLLLSFLVLIRNTDDGMRWIFFLVSIIFAGDIAALYAGTFFGRHKLAPAVSPGKTIQGSIGGIAANIAVGSLAKFIFLPFLPWPSTILFCVIAGVAGQIGDLFESALKRASNVKDSGGILPGHGGILDRIDALLFAAPVAYFFRVYIF